MNTTISLFVALLGHPVLYVEVCVWGGREVLSANLFVLTVTLLCWCINIPILTIVVKCTDKEYEENIPTLSLSKIQNTSFL